jgi:SAM-dependent methyltransferase
MFFVPTGTPPRPGARCPHCGALERHRTLWPFLRDVITPDDRVLHFAPEAILVQCLRRVRHASYTAADLDAVAYSERIGAPVTEADLMNLPWPDDSFDKIILSHVLEHVPDDMRAMQELRRTLATGGEVISQHPYKPDRAHTFEDPSITSPEERFKAYGQVDHVRLYGRDLMDRWQQAGFEIEVFPDENPGSTIVRAREPVS